MKQSQLTSALGSVLFAALIVASCGLLAGPALAQQSGGSKLADEARVLSKQYVDAFNRKDAAAVAALYADDGVFIGGAGEIVSGRAAIEKLFSTVVGKFTIDLGLDQVHAAGNGGWGVGHGKQTIQGQSGTKEVLTHFMVVYVHEGDALKLRAAAVGVNVAPAPSLSAK